MRHTLLPLNVSGSFFFLCSLRFVATSFIFSRPGLCTLLSSPSPCSPRSVCLSAISSLYMSAGTRHTSWTKGNIWWEGSPVGFLIQAANKRRRSAWQSTGGSKRRRSSLSLSLFHSVNHTCAHTAGSEVSRADRLSGGGEMLAQRGPTRSAERLIAVINMRWCWWETKTRRTSPRVNLREGSGCFNGLNRETHKWAIYTPLKKHVLAPDTLMHTEKKTHTHTQTSPSKIFLQYVVRTRVSPLSRNLFHLKYESLSGHKWSRWNQRGGLTPSWN